MSQSLVEEEAMQLRIIQPKLAQSSPMNSSAEKQQDFKVGNFAWIVPCIYQIKQNTIFKTNKEKEIY